MSNDKEQYITNIPKHAIEYQGADTIDNLSSQISFFHLEIKKIRSISLVLIKTMFKSYRFYEVVWPPEKEVTKRIV